MTLSGGGLVRTGDCDRLCDFRANGAAACDVGHPIGRRIVERAANEIGDLLEMFLRQGVDKLSLVGGCPERLRLG
jgi:N-acetylglucosamine kinase-like BadF-type ATPase